ncbi:MAG: DUF4178 domain-containing protein [Gordonia sp. (in: high G+C Gram-positive bacteria)]|uniref:DUF4178 domain-containing protein n=1 Tax=Gordonia sp. (in: high G+C Gram-positive bacteria) TaxID=84139 RepID=UPI0039E6C191
MKYAVILIIALLLIIAVAVVFNVLQAQAARKAEADALRNRTYRPGDPFSSADDDAVHGDPRQLKPSDLVDIRGTTFAVRGIIRFTQDGYNWIEAHLDTGTGRRAWLSVEDDPDLEVVMWQDLSGVTLQPGPPTVEFEGRRYTFDEDGSARFTSAGTTGVATSGSMRYHDYQAGGDRLSFEDYGSGWEAARGELLARGEFRIYPSNPAPEGPR